MKFHSILFDEGGLDMEAAQLPDFFTDLNLDQVIDAVTAGREDYDLQLYYWSPLQNAETIRYRHEVMRDLEDPTLLEAIREFAGRMTLVRRHLGKMETLENVHHRQGWFLEAALAYCAAVMGLGRGLERIDLLSRGFLGFDEYLREYAGSPGFQNLQRGAEAVKAGLMEARYCLNIELGRFTVQRYEGESNYSEEVERVFEKFKQDSGKEQRTGWKPGARTNPVEVKILALVARLYPREFAALDQFCAQHRQFVDETIRLFDRQVQFYMAYREWIDGLRRKGLAFCYPQVGPGQEVFSREGFDLALAHSLAGTDRPIVCNDFELHDPERILVVTGPNQGGKTTFARTFGQLHYLASLGLPVPGREARLLLCDRIFTHFERQEDIRTLRGKLQDDLERIHEILLQATPRSILILNEIFESTTLGDAVFLSREIMARLAELDVLCVWVTFIDELASASEKTVSMVSTVLDENPALRTFRVVRRPADGLAYAISIAEKHRLTYPQIQERIPS